MLDKKFIDIAINCADELVGWGRPDETPVKFTFSRESLENFVNEIMNQKDPNSLHIKLFK